jgi:acylphosphatase
MQRFGWLIGFASVATEAGRTMSRPTRTAHVRVQGRVQGVGYRIWSQRTAVELGLSGWVRNLRDGSVEAVFEGPAENVAKMVARCATGPRGASVSRVEDLGGDGGPFSGFEVRDTA